MDMSGVTLLDSTGISALVTFHKRFRSYGGELRIVVTDHNVSKVLSITAVDQVLAIFNTLQEAASPASQRAS